MANAPSNVTNVLRAQGVGAAVSLLEIETVAGVRFYLADAPISALSALSAFDADPSPIAPRPRPIVYAPGGGSASYAGGLVSLGPYQANFLPWLTTPPTWKVLGLLQMMSSSVRFQNLSGNTITRDGSVIFTRSQLWGALFIYRLWRPESEYAMVTVVGNVTDVSGVGDQEIELALKSWMNWSEIKAPDCTVDVSCGNVFGSQQCGSTSSTPCQNTYGSCSQLNRFKAIVTQWADNNTQNPPTISYAQTPPATDINLRRPA